MQHEDGNGEAVIELNEVHTRFGSRVVHQGVTMRVHRGEIFAIVGGSGSGKSTLLREMVALLKPNGGSVRIFGREVAGEAEDRLLWLRRRTGVLFQNGALFGGLTVIENVSAPLREHTRLAEALIHELAAVKLGLAGLDVEVAPMYPNELSGGMRKRAALARALALDPEILFLDEPTSGLDPVNAEGLDELVLRLKNSLGLTVVMVTHDLDTLWRVADRVAVLGDGRLVALGHMRELSLLSHPRVREFFQGVRGRRSGLHP